VDRLPVGRRRDLAVQVGDAEVIARLRLLGLMVRPRAAITMWTFLVIGLARHAGPTISTDLVWATIALAASYAVATSMNDIADVQIDRTNGLRDASRPLATGTASVADVRWTAATAGTIAIAAALPLGAPGLAVIGLCLAVDLAYSATPARVSRRWTLAPIALTVAYVALPYLLGIVVAHGAWDAADLPLVAGLCVLFFARIILKDVRDRLGDAAHGKQTLLLRLGKDTTCVVSIVAAAVGIVVIVLAIRPPAPVVVAIAFDAAAIVWMLARLRVTTDPTAELVTIGTAARAGNAVLVAVIAWLLLSAQDAPPMQASLVVATLTAVAAVGFLDLALKPERARVAYKG
jgi:4-hydroxybenzoate polyprenyltransferase